VDHIATSLETKKFCSGLFLEDASILAAASDYENNFSVSMMSCLKAEISIWKNQWESESAVKAHQHRTELLPNVKKLLKSFACNVSHA